MNDRVFKILFALCVPSFWQIFATDEAEKTEPWIGDRPWWLRFSTVMYPIFIGRRGLLFCSWKVHISLKLKNRKTDRTVGLNFCISNISSGTAWLLSLEVRPCLTKYWKYKSSIQPYGQFFCFSVFFNPKFCWSDPPGSGSFALSVGPFSSLKSSYVVIFLNLIFN